MGVVDKVLSKLTGEVAYEARLREVGQRIAEANAIYDAKHRAAQDAIESGVEVIEALALQREADAALADLNRLQTQQKTLRSALEGIRAKAEADRLAREKAAAWAKADELLAERTKLARGVEASITSMADALARINAIGREVAETVPTSSGVDTSLHGGPLSSDAVAESFRISLARAGWTWATFAPPNDIGNRLSIGDQVEKSAGLVLANRDA